MRKPSQHPPIHFAAVSCFLLAGTVANSDAFSSEPESETQFARFQITDPQPDPSSSPPAMSAPILPSDEAVIEQPSLAAAPPPAPTSSLLSELEVFSPVREAELGSGIAVNVVSGNDVTFLGAADTGELLVKSVFNTGVYSSQVSPVITSARVRGYRYSQIRTTLDGAAWFPVRPDADTPLSRFDSNIVEDVAIIRGPYNVRLGPGFAFIDVALRSTPRYESGFQTEGLTKFTWDTNGAQWYGRQSVQGGGSDRGWRIGYAQRGGSDFSGGDGKPLAASYNVGDFDLAYGIDLTDSSSLEFTYIRTEMTNVETPGQVNDFRYLISNGLSLNCELKDQPYFDRLAINGWYNLSDFAGTVKNKAIDPADPRFFFPPANPLFPDRFARVTTYGNTSSEGLRMTMSWGSAESNMLTAGADVTMLRQTYLEQREGNGVIDFGLPKSHQSDPGLFVDNRFAATDQLTIKSGARLDFVHSVSEATASADARSLALNTNAPLPQSFTLGAGFLSADYKFDEAVTMNGGVGYAQRAPSLTDLYGDLPHLSTMQEGAFFVPHGDLTLQKERALQADLGLTTQTDPFRGGVNVFYSHVGDFITYDVPHLPPPSGPHEQHAIGVNRDAQFAGGECYGNLKFSEPFSAFGTLSYVQGKDIERNEPMWGVAPLEARFGLRLVDSNAQRWGAEYTMRIVDEQNRLSTVGFVGEQATPSFNTHSVRGYYKWSRAVSLVAGVENIGDTFYREHLDTRLDVTLGADPSRGVVRRGRSIYFALQAEY